MTFIKICDFRRIQKYGPPFLLTGGGKPTSKEETMDSLLKMEDGGFLLLEDGTRIVLEMETLMASNKISLDNYAIDEI